MPNREEMVKGAAKMTPEKAHDPSNPKVYFDIKIGDPHAGRVVFEVCAMIYCHRVQPACMCTLTSYVGGICTFAVCRLFAAIYLRRMEK